jgi:hypothetical protein
MMTLSESNELIEYIETSLNSTNDIKLVNISIDYTPSNKVWAFGIRYSNRNYPSKRMQTMFFSKEKCNIYYIKDWIVKEFLKGKGNYL